MHNFDYLHGDGQTRCKRCNKTFHVEFMKWGEMITGYSWEDIGNGAALHKNEDGTFNLGKSKRKFKEIPGGVQEILDDPIT